MAAVPCAAQRPAVDRQEHIRIQLRALDAGSRVPRLPKSDGSEASSPAPFTVTGRKTAWQIGSTEIGNPDSLRSELARIRADKSSRRRDPATGEVQLMPVVISPDQRVHWVDIVQTIDLAMEAGFADINLADVGDVAIIFVAKAVADPVSDAGAHVVPRADYSVPDEDPPGYWRPVLHVRQDGRIEHEGVVAFAPNRDKGEAAKLKELLAELAKTARDKHGAERVGPDRGEFANARLLLHADKWAAWSDVRRVLQLATRTDPAFWKFEYAVGDYDFEARLRAGERFEERKDKR